MNHTRQIRHRALLLVAAVVALSLASSRMLADTGTCNGASITLPFTDLPSSNGFFCMIASAYFSGVANGTSGTTYSPSANVTRDQMAAFVSRTLDQSLRRGSPRGALDQRWTSEAITSDAKTLVGVNPRAVQSDGTDLWVANSFNGTVSRVRASDGRLLGTWSGATSANCVLAARGLIFVAGGDSLYSIDPRFDPPSTPPFGDVTLVTDELVHGPSGIAYDGLTVWTANGSSVSIVRFSSCAMTACVTTVTAGFQAPVGILYDGSHIWVTDPGDNTLKKLHEDASIALTLPMGTYPRHPSFDGTNLWVPNFDSDSVTVVRVKDSLGNPLVQPFVLATLTGNGLDSPHAAAFDGQRILVTNNLGNSVSLWRATDLTPLGSFTTGTDTFPLGACSDGINFWIALSGTNRLGRF